MGNRVCPARNRLINVRPGSDASHPPAYDPLQQTHLLMQRRQSPAMRFARLFCFSEHTPSMTMCKLFRSADSVRNRI